MQTEKNTDFIIVPKKNLYRNLSKPRIFPFAGKIRQSNAHICILIHTHTWSNVYVFIAEIQTHRSDSNKKESNEEKNHSIRWLMVLRHIQKMCFSLYGWWWNHQNIYIVSAVLFLSHDDGFCFRIAMEKFKLTHAGVTKYMRICTACNICVNRTIPIDWNCCTFTHQFVLTLELILSKQSVGTPCTIHSSLIIDISWASAWLRWLVNLIGV